MNKNFLFLLLLLLPIIILACASANTELSSFIDPDHKGNVYRNIAVYAEVENLMERELLESSMVNALGLAGIAAIQSLVLFPPMKEFTIEEADKIIRSKNIEAFIVIIPGDKGIDVDYIPQFGSYTYKSGKVSSSGKYKGKEYTTYYGGFDVKKPWALFSAIMIDYETKNKVWLGSAKSRGNKHAQMKTLMGSFSKEVVQKLQEENLLH